MNKDNPLYLPKGSVRAILALGLVGSVIYSALLGEVSQVIGALAAVVVGFYFKGREGS